MRQSNTLTCKNNILRMEILTMKVTTKGQVTVPLRLRRKAGIFPGCEVEFYEEKGRIIIRKVKDSNRGKALVEQMTGRGNVHMTTDEIMALTRGQT